MAEYTIKEISKMFSIPASTLRYYENIGILNSIPRTSSGKRVYQDCHINRLETICCLKYAGMSIAQIQDFLRDERYEQENICRILRLLETHKNSVREKIDRLEEEYAYTLQKLQYYYSMIS